MEDEFLQKIVNTIEQHKMLVGVKHLLVAFSAGPDSVCLLDCLHRLYGNKIRITLAYINHQLRTAALTEEEMTRKYARSYKVGYRIVRVDVRNSLGREGLEATARNLRYAALTGLAKKIRAQRTALAHNADDFIETFFLNLVRGAGRLGMAGMQPVRDLFIRPLLALRKSEILVYLKKRHLKYSFDRTNLSLRFRRNYLRKEIIPRLIRLNSNLYGTLFREMELMRLEDDYLQAETDRIFRLVGQRRASGIELDIRKLFKYNMVFVRRLLRKAILLVKSDLHGIECEHVDDMIALKNRHSGKVIHLPQGISVAKEYDRLVVSNENKVARGFKRNLAVPGRSILERPGLRITTRLERSIRRLRISRQPGQICYFDFDRLRPPLFVRNRKPGDWLTAFDGHTKKIKGILINSKIPRTQRDRIPLLGDQEGILWLMGLARSNRAKVTNKTKRILVVKIENLDQRSEDKK